MLRELRIKNLALIEDLQLIFGKGLTVLTGETGAGKSIVLQAVQLLAGERGTPSWIRTGADSASVEALFELENKNAVIEEALGEDLDPDNTIILKRALSANGKSRFYINGNFSTAKMAGQIFTELVSLASQHAHQQLLNPHNHLLMVDAVGNLDADREELTTLHEQWRAVRTEYEQLQRRQAEKEQRRDFLTFQINEITEAGIIPSEDEALAREKKRLQSADDLILLGQETYHDLEETAIDVLARARSNLVRMSAMDQEVSSLAENMEGLYYQVVDLIAEIRRYLDDIPNDPEKLETIGARLDLLGRLNKKYGPTLQDVLSYADKAREELTSFDSMDERLYELGRKITTTEDRLVQKATMLSVARRKTADLLGQAIAQELFSLCLDQTRFEVNFFDPKDKGLTHLTRTGWDEPEFMFSANPGEPIKSLSKVASGGELSRLMLALKCFLARKDQVETVIFDEVDAGLSGKAAEAVARKIKELSQHHQVLCITHLAQIASYADEHFLVTKEVREDRTHTYVKGLGYDLRVSELGRMLDGDSVTDETFSYVKTLLTRNQQVPKEDF